MSMISRRIGQNIICQNTDERTDEWLFPSDITQSWCNPVAFIQENAENGTVGLRTAQLGAIFAIKSH